MMMAAPEWGSEIMYICKVNQSVCRIAEVLK
jgi:hypothetical protein